MSKEICQESWLILQGRQTQTGVPHEDRTTVEAAAAAAKSLQPCLVLCDPMNSSPPGSCLRDSPDKNTGVDCYFLIPAAEENVTKTQISMEICYNLE